MIIVATTGIALHFTRPDAPDPGGDCEAISAGLLRQPGNTLSALLMLGAGMLIFGMGGRRRRLLGSGIAAAGAGSTLLHATMHPIAGWLDGIGTVFAVASVIVALVGTSPEVSRLLLAAAVAAGGGLIWVGSRTGQVWCDPQAIVGGHAVWHAMVALSAVITASSITTSTSQ